MNELKTIEVCDIVSTVLVASDLDDSQQAIDNAEKLWPIGQLTRSEGDVTTYDSFLAYVSNEDDPKYFDKGYRIALGGHLRQEQQILEQTQEKIEFVQCVVDDFNYIEKKMDKEVVISKGAPDVNNPEKEQYFTDPETGLVFPVEHELTPEEKKSLEELRESLHENPSEPVVEQSHDDTIAIEDEVIEDDNEIAGPDEAL